MKIVCNTQGDNVKSDAFRGKSVVPEVSLETLEELANDNNPGNELEEDMDGDLTDTEVDD